MFCVWKKLQPQNKEECVSESGSTDRDPQGHSQLWASWRGTGGGCWLGLHGDTRLDVWVGMEVVTSWKHEDKFGFKEMTGSWRGPGGQCPCVPPFPISLVGVKFPPGSAPALKHWEGSAVVAGVAVA